MEAAQAGRAQGVSSISAGAPYPPSVQWHGTAGGTVVRTPTHPPALSPSVDQVKGWTIDGDSTLYLIQSSSSSPYKVYFLSSVILIEWKKGLSFPSDDLRHLFVSNLFGSFSHTCLIRYLICLSNPPCPLPRILSSRTHFSPLLSITSLSVLHHI